MKTLTTVAAVAAALGLAACSGPAETDAAADDMAMVEETPADTAMDTGTIVELAQSNPDLSTLVAAVQAADLGGTLSGAGPFTVFAPAKRGVRGRPQSGTR